jgi:hypothetical protein
MKVDVCLKKLVSDWAFRRDREGFTTMFLENPHLPLTIQAQITDIEPFRSRAIEDAKLHYAMPIPFGFGMEMYLPKTFELVPYGEWRETIENLTFQVEYCKKIDGTDCRRYNLKIARIGRENGSWKIIEAFDEEERAEMLKAFREMKEFHARKEK